MASTTRVQGNVVYVEVSPTAHEKIVQCVEKRQAGALTAELGDTMLRRQLGSEEGRHFVKLFRKTWPLRSQSSLLPCQNDP